MPLSTFDILSLAMLVGAIWFLIHRRATNGFRKLLPPGPPGLHAVENFHLVDPTSPHRSLRDLSEKYGSIMSLWLGSTHLTIVSSPAAAELFLKTHDRIFASRPQNQQYEKYSYGSKGIAFVPYGPYWRSTRKLFAMELLSAAKIDSYRDMRKEEVCMATETIKAVPPGQAVDLSERVERLIEDMSYRMVFGQRSDVSVDLTAAINEMSQLIGFFATLDYVPVFHPLDFQVLTQRMKILKKTIEKIMDGIIDEHEKEDEEEATTNQPPQRDFIYVLLSLMNKSLDKSLSAHEEIYYSVDRDSIKALVLDTVFGSIDTSSAAIVWVMTELLRHPRVMKKIQEEIKSVVGEDRMVDEKDLSEFKYLEMVIKETLRLHPVTPLLVPRESTEGVVINGYYIPKKTKLLVNYWAIGRDPKVWSENVDEFLPERFVDSKIDFRGHQFQLLPFGSGRRGCPGMNLGMINIRLVVSQLVHCFDWEPPHGMSPTEIDTTEKFGLLLTKASHLLAGPTYRLGATSCNFISPTT